MNQQRAKCRDGFTLVELLVSIVILAILGTLILAGVDKAKRLAWASESSSNIRQLATANLAYVSDHGHFVPYANGYNTMRWCGGLDGNGRFDPTRGYLADYLGKSRKVTACPLFVDMIDGPASFELGTGGYGYNSSYIGGRPGGATEDGLGYGPYVAATPAQIANPTETVMFTTTALANGNSVQEYPFSEPPFWDFGNGPIGRRPTPSTHFRFDGKAIVAWADGHVTFEERGDRSVGNNPYGGDAKGHQLGWFGPDENNGYWNPEN